MTKNDLIGSESRDKFKWLHKQKLPSDCYAADADLMIVTKNPPRIAGLIDFKRGSDSITFAEVIAYNHLLDMGVSVYIVSSNDFETFDVERYLWGDFRPHPPEIVTERVVSGVDWDGLGEWEREVRGG